MAPFLRHRVRHYSVRPRTFAIRIAKEAVNAAFETSLAEGVSLERRLFSLLFSTEDQKEGMAAFIEKRKAEWKGK